MDFRNLSPGLLCRAFTASSSELSFPWKFVLVRPPFTDVKILGETVSEWLSRLQYYFIYFYIGI